MSVQKFEACSSDHNCIRNPNARPDERHTILESNEDRGRMLAQINDAIDAAARSGSPEGWPEGAELRTTAQILDEPGVWQVWNQPVIGDGSWTSIDEMTPGGLGVLGNCFPARRKPKPVTRDVLAWDLEPGMKSSSWMGPLLRVTRNRGRTVTIFTRAEEIAYDHCPADASFAVLVEEPNG